MFIESLRADSLYTNFFGLEFRTSQVLAAVIFTACASVLLYNLIKKPKKTLYLKKIIKKQEKKAK